MSNKINNFKNYLNTRDFTNYDGADDEDEFGNFTNPEPEEEEIKRVPKMGEKGSPFKWPKPLTDDTDVESEDMEERFLKNLRKTIKSHNSRIPGQKPERDMKERPTMNPTNENIITKFDNFIR